MSESESVGESVWVRPRPERRAERGTHCHSQTIAHTNSVQCTCVDGAFTLPSLRSLRSLPSLRSLRSLPSLPSLTVVALDEVGHDADEGAAAAEDVEGEGGNQHFLVPPIHHLVHFRHQKHGLHQDERREAAEADTSNERPSRVHIVSRHREVAPGAVHPGEHDEKGDKFAQQNTE